MIGSPSLIRFNKTCVGAAGLASPVSGGSSPPPPPPPTVAVITTNAPALSVGQLTVYGNQSTGAGLTYAWTLGGPSSGGANYSFDGSFLSSNQWTGNNPCANTTVNPPTINFGGTEPPAVVGGYTISLQVTDSQMGTDETELYLMVEKVEGSPPAILSSTTPPAGMIGDVEASAGYAEGDVVWITDVGFPENALRVSVYLLNESGQFFAITTITESASVALTGVPNGTYNAYGTAYSYGENGPTNELATGIVVQVD